MLYTDTLVSNLNPTMAISIKPDPTTGLFMVHFHMAYTESKPFPDYASAKNWVDLYGPLYTEGLDNITTPSL